jgi:hypothetical protein
MATLLAEGENALYLKNSSGANHALAGRRYARLRKEILAGRGGPEVTSLVASGYTGFVGSDGEVWDFEALAQHFGRKS